MGGSGGGGYFESLENFVNQSLGDVGEVFTGTKQREAMKEESRKAGIAQEKREKQMAEQEAKSQEQSKFATAKNRQRMMSGKGRSSTILTSPLGTPADSAAPQSGKTLLGS